MARFFRMMGWVVVAMGLAACSQRPPQGIPPSRWALREFMLIRGAVMCVDCRLEEAQKRYPDTDGLYEFNGARGPIVFRVDWVNDAVRWRQLTLGHRLSMRAADEVLQQLTALEHLRRPMELNAVLRDERTLNIGSVTLIG